MCFLMRIDSNFRNYKPFHKFIKNYAPTDFQGINRNDPLILELEEMTEANNQYFFIADILQGNIIFTSNRSIQMVGIDPEELNPYHNIEAVHPDEVYRNTSGWAKLLTMANDLFFAKTGSSTLSVNMKMRNPKGKYSEILFQAYLFYSEAPRRTVYDLQVHTNIDSFKKRKHGYHYYAGNDLSCFRYPDEELLEVGTPYSAREFEIIHLIEHGLSTKEIAKKLFLSPYTVNTHRRNILIKAGKVSISDLIYELKERGMM